MSPASLPKTHSLKTKFQQLQSQIIQLKQQLSESEVLYSLLDFARERPENKYVAASVIGRDPSPFLHYVIIDHGSDDGIQYGMPVVTQQGLVGRVDAVTAGAARVQLITDPGSAVNIRLEKQGWKVRQWDQSLAIFRWRWWVFLPSLPPMTWC